jgi:hypothetical protein
MRFGSPKKKVNVEQPPTLSAMKIPLKIGCIAGLE